MKNHKAKRINDGEYAYRGFIILRIKHNQWNIKFPREESFSDAANSLTDAKQFIDKHIGG